jgi:hypothetical protein
MLSTTCNVVRLTTATAFASGNAISSHYSSGVDAVLYPVAGSVIERST